jgi:hypothetical protein
LEVEATRTKEQGRGGDLSIGLVYRGRQCALHIDRNWGRNSTVTGQDEVGTLLDFLKHERGPLLTSGRRSKITCTVREDGFRISIDGNQVFDFSGEPTWAETNSYWSVPDKNALMIGSFQEAFEIHSMKLTPLRDTSPASTPSKPGKPIDLLSLVDTERNSVLGAWRMERGELLAPRLADGARLQIPVEVPEVYDLELDVTRNAGGNELAVGLIYQGKQCSVGIDRYSARATDIVADTGRSESVVAHSGEANVLKSGARSQVKCEVRKKSITVSVNGRTIVSYEGDATWRGMNSGWAVPDKQALMLGAWFADFRIHSFKLTPVGAGDAGGPSRPRALSEKPVDLLAQIDPDKHAVDGKWEIRGTTLFTSNAEYGRLTIPFTPPEEYQVELDVRQMLGTGPIVMGLVMQDRQFAVSVGQGYAQLHAIDGKAVDGVQGKEFLKIHQFCKVICTVKPGHVKVTCDGVSALEVDCDVEKLSLPNEWKVPDEKLLFIGASHCVHHVSSIRLTPISGQDSKQPDRRRLR